jgi:hypothetical protein
MSARRAAAVCGVTRFAVRAWMDRGLLPEPPWTVQQLRQVSDAAEPRPGPRAPHGTRARWSHGCGCPQCRQAQNDTGRAYGRAGAQDRLPVEVRQRLLDGIYAGRSFRTILRDLGLTPNQVWGLTKSDEQWAGALETALTATRRDDLKHGTTAAYVGGCVCSECREHQRSGWPKTSRDPLANVSQ